LSINVNRKNGKKPDISCVWQVGNTPSLYFHFF
jgi:hypothetical protein